MSKKNHYNYTKIIPILKKAGIKVFPPNLDKNNPRLRKQVHIIFIRICKKYGLDIQKRIELQRPAFYQSLFDEIFSIGRIDKEIFLSLAEPMLINEYQLKQDTFMKNSIGRVIFPEHSVVLGGLPGAKFYQTPEWRGLRYATLEKYGNKCQACGRSPNNGTIIHVDHIKPRSYYPELALDPDNLQILCEDCNIGKSNRFKKDWR